jgi:hypothetical protein
MTVSLKRFEGTFWVEVTGFRAEEVELPAGDHSCIEKFRGETWASNTFQIPFGEGWIFHSYPTLSSTTVQYRYTDIGTAPDIFTGLQLVDAFIVAGSTDHGDICGMTEDDTHLHWLVTQVIPARFRR